MRLAWRRTALIVFVVLAPVVWEICAGLLLLASGPPDELRAFAVGKLGFAAVLALTLTATRGWTAAGFAGGLQLRRWGLLWPIWLAALISGLQGVAGHSLATDLAWAPIAAAVSFGEEGIFRGVLIALLDRRYPRRAAVLSAVLFGGVHLAGLLSPLDWRVILAQAVTAGGLGLVLAATRLLARSIWPGIVAHAVLDYLGILAAGGVSEALTYSPGDVVYMLVGAALSIGWGAVLVRRLPPVWRPSE